MNRGDIPLVWWTHAEISARHAPRPNSEPGPRAFWRATGHGFLRRRRGAGAGPRIAALAKRAMVGERGRASDRHRQIDHEVPAARPVTAQGRARKGRVAAHEAVNRATPPRERPVQPADTSTQSVMLTNPLGLGNWQITQKTVFALHNRTAARCTSGRARSPG